MLEIFSKIYDHDDNLILNTVKILIIIFVSISLIANFSPYYHGIDSFVYGISAIDLANGSYGFTNKFLQETGDWEFIPNQWVKTIHNTAIPIGGVGIYGIATIAYIIGGNYGLFYLVPIATILLLIFSERIATNLFGRFVGFVTLILVATDITIFNHGTQLLTDNIFTLLFILGVFYFIKFLHDGQERFILLSSVFFVASTFLRYNGIIVFPIEIILVIGNLVLFSKITTKNEPTNPINSSSNIFSLTAISKKYIKINIFLIAPWIFFFLFLFSYNQYYFGDPFINYFDQSPWPNDYQRGSIESFFEFDNNRIEWIKLYAIELLPDKLHLDLQNLFLNYLGSFIGSVFEAFLLFAILIVGLVISIYDKQHRTELIVFILLILGLVALFSSNLVTSMGGAEIKTTWTRYMIPLLPLVFMYIGFIIHRIWEKNLKNNIKSKPIWIYSVLRIGFLAVIFYFFICSFYDSISFQEIVDFNFKINNPQVYAEENKNTNEIPKNSIVFGGSARRALLHDGIPLYPFWGYWPLIREEWRPDLVDTKPIDTLKKLMENGYQAFVLKPKTDIEIQYYRYLESNYGIIQKIYSLNYCKIELIENFNENNTAISKSDNICYGGQQLIFTKPVIINP